MKTDKYQTVSDIDADDPAAAAAAAAAAARDDDRDDYRDDDGASKLIVFNSVELIRLQVWDSRCRDH